MGSPLGPLMANAFMCSIEERLKSGNKLPSFYRRYVDDTLTMVPDIPSAEAFLTTLNESHPSITFTMEITTNNKLPFVGMEIEMKGNQLTTRVHRKTTNKGLLLHYQSHVDNKYKHSLLKTMLIRAHRLSSSPDLFADECNNLRSMFLKLKYPPRLIESTINRFVRSQDQPEPQHQFPQDQPIRIVLPFKDQRSADAVRKDLSELSKKIGSDLRPVFTSRKIIDDIKDVEVKPPLINQHCVVYKFSCDLCDTDYVGYTSRHLFQRIAEHKHSAIGKHLQEEHRLQPTNLQDQFRVLKKCRTKFDCLIYEMLFTRNIKPKLNTQSDSVRAKLFT